MGQQPFLKNHKIEYTGKIKTIVSCFLILTMIFTYIPTSPAKAAAGLSIYNYTTKKTSIYTGNQIKVSFKGNEISNSLTPGINVDEVAMVSYEDIFSKSRIAAVCVYSSTKSTITITKNSKTVIMTLGSKVAKVNGVKVNMPAAPVKLKFVKAQLTKIYVPVQFVTEAIGYLYSINSSKSVITLDKKTIRLAYNSGKSFEYTGVQGKVSFDGKEIGLVFMPGIMVNNNLMVPAQTVFADSGIGAVYKYDSAKKMISLTKNGITIKMTIGSMTAYVNGSKKTLTAAPFLVTNYDSGHTYTMIPCYFTATNLGFDYYWNKSTSTSQITTRKKVTPDPYGNTSGNLNQDGIFAYRNGWLYTNTIDNTYLYKFRTDGSQKTMINIKYAKDLNVTDNYIYYLSTVQNGSLYRASLDGTNNSLINSTDIITHFILYDKYIYYVNYSDNNRIYRMNMDGTGRKKLTDDKNCNYLNVTGTYVIYSTGTSGIVRMNFDGTGRMKLSSLNAGNLVTDKEYVYFINPNLYGQNLYKVKFDGTGQTKLSEDNAYSLNLSGNALYFQNMDDNGKLYAIKSDGTARTKILDTSTNTPSVADGYLYYEPDNFSYTGELHRIKLTALVEENNPADAVGNLADNIINGAFTAYNGKNIYMGGETGLYQMPVDYMDKTPFNNYKYKEFFYGIFSLNAVGDYLYYTLTSPYNSETAGIYKVKADRSQAPVKLSNKTASNMIVIGNWIYFIIPASDDKYSGGGPIFKMRIDGTGISPVSLSGAGYGRSMTIAGDYIYYINDKDNRSIYRMKLDGSSIQRLSDEENLCSIHVYGDSIYYNSYYHNKLMKMPIGGGNATELLDYVNKKLVIYQDRIYYYTINTLNSCELDGSDVKVLADGVLPLDLNITAGYIYYYRNDPDQTLNRIRLSDMLSGDSNADGMTIDKLTDKTTYYQSSGVHDINPDIKPLGSPGMIRYFNTVTLREAMDSVYRTQQNKQNIETFSFTGSTPFQSITSSYNAQNKLLSLTVKDMNYSMEPVTDLADTSMSNLANKISFSYDKVTCSTAIKLSVLPEGITYDVKLSDDRKTLYLNLYINALTGLTFKSDQAYDTLTLTGLSPLKTVISRDDQSNALNINLPFTTDGVGYISQALEGSLVFDKLDARNNYENTDITLSSTDKTYYNYETLIQGNQVTIRLYKTGALQQ